MRDRALRRKMHFKAVDRARRKWGKMLWNRSKSYRYIDFEYKKKASVRTPCSCFMCSRSRRYHGPPASELRHPDMKDWLEELHLSEKEERQEEKEAYENGDYFIEDYFMEQYQQEYEEEPEEEDEIHFYSYYDPIEDWYYVDYED